MAAMDVELDGQALATLLTSEHGMVGTAILDGATRVQDAARDQVGKDTRDLERSIVKRPFLRGGEFGVRVGSDVTYALIHHEGRGEVVPVNAKVLRFKAGGQVVYSQRSAAVPPNRYLTDNLPRALP